MAFKLCSRVISLKSNLWMTRATFSVLNASCSFTVEHDRQKQRFTATPASGKITGGISRQVHGASECAVLQYRYTAEKEVDLLSTYVPESFRGQGVAALLSQAAMNFLVEENLKACVTCWYIQKYIKDHPQHGYEDLIITKQKPQCPVQPTSPQAK